MDTDAYLQQYINALKLVHSDEIIAVQDLNFYHKYCTPKYIQLFNFEKDPYGLRFQDIGTDFFKNFTTLLALSTQASAKNIGNVRFFFNGIPNDGSNGGELTCYQVEGRPIIMPGSNITIGRIAKINIFDVNFLNQMIYTINLFDLESLSRRQLSNPPSSNEIAELALTEREREVLFLLTLGKKYKNIATILSEVYKIEVKESAISNIVHKQLFSKFNAYSIEMLVQKALELGVITTLPKNLQRAVNGILNLQIIKPVLT